MTATRLRGERLDERGRQLEILERLDALRVPFQVREGMVRLHRGAVVPETLAAEVELHRAGLGALLKIYEDAVCAGCGGIVFGTLVVDHDAGGGKRRWHGYCAPEVRRRRRKPPEGATRV